MEYKRSGVKQILISICLFIILEFILGIVFISIDEAIYGLYEDPDYINPIGRILSIVISFIVVAVEYLISRFNYVNKIENTAENLANSIKLYENKNKKLYEKANELYYTFLYHEEKIQLGINTERVPEQMTQINSQNTLNRAIQLYPDLKGNSHMANLLNQIERSENEVVGIKQSYNNIASQYNEEVSKVLIKLFSKKKKLAYYNEDLEPDF